MAKSISHDIIVTPDHEPIVLSGPPGELIGQVELYNSSDGDVVLRDASLKDKSGELVTTPARQSFPTVVLRPKQGRLVALSIAVDPSTPPGEYPAELEMGGVSRTVVLQVTELFELTVRPERLIVFNRPKEAQHKRLVITNDGNVAFGIGDIGSVDLEDDMIAERSGRVAIEPLTHGERRKGEEPVLALVRIGRAGDYIEDGLRVHTLDGPIEVAPGETSTLDLEITVQTDLPKNRRYRGRAPLLTHNLEIVVVTAGDPTTGKTAKRAHARHGKPAGGATTK